MDKLIAIVFALYVLSKCMGCATTADYEMHLFMNKGADVATGYYTNEEGTTKFTIHTGEEND